MINENMKTPTSDTFNVAQKQIYMQKDSYPRFVLLPSCRNFFNSFGIIEEEVDILSTDTSIVIRLPVTRLPQPVNFFLVMFIYSE
ncbi:hypothetical protein GCK72_022397 [Caenorhabditis remanei]|uniref:Uncharacterized protein n=1 Tax=Caenorhabditis remanei TaxID=31234 RepID=A0A6A5FTX1_CAERE|nr:hypothetical protein GCK72_022397 [Caenorhabditis remanei]KAF1745949.1 hypothetical protein GCK72_022397 [Caenorhabditis remanei]